MLKIKVAERIYIAILLAGGVMCILLSVNADKTMFIDEAAAELAEKSWVLGLVLINCALFCCFIEWRKVQSTTVINLSSSE